MLAKFTRKFDSALACALDEEDVTKQVYSSLIKAVRENLPILFKYFIMQFLRSSLSLSRR